MSLRDYFAAHCPNDLIDRGNGGQKAKIIGRPQPSDFHEMLKWNSEVEAFIRYQYADAMLAEREKQQNTATVNAHPSQSIL
jgi:hypothetical protein